MKSNLPTHWTTEAKVEIAIVDMTDSHIANCINMLERYIDREMDRYDSCYGHGFNGEMACYYAELDASLCEDRILKMRLAQKALVLEQQARKALKTEV
jgi:hypothetical protein